ncbi:MAG: DUF547 domain-containing protein [Deltaproteobacteria bacterium]|nr:DUF547 domain-containing protein [Deltaproteobacteria bacterium]
MDAQGPLFGAPAQRAQTHGRRAGTRLALRAAIVLGLAALAAPALAAPADQATGGAPCAPFDHEHAAWEATLARYVRDGVVDYSGLKHSGTAALDGYLRSLESVCRDQYVAWTREQQLAFFINAYNAYTIKLILEHYPVKSIRSIGFLPGSAFRDELAPLRWLRGKALSLNDIENDILRKDFHEPRIHFAIVCASQSCPELKSEAYRATTLDSQLTDAARRFLADRGKNQFDPASRTLRLSSIFKWFREDFERTSRTLPAFVARYAEPATATALSSGDAVRIEFLDYDWSLNGS